MASGLATAQVNAILDAICRSVAYSDPAGFYVKLHTGNPGSAGANNAAANTTRQQATFAAATGGVSTTTADLVWSSVPNSETYSHISFWSASTSGTFLGSDILDVARTVTAGDTFEILAGNLTLTLAPLAA